MVSFNISEQQLSVEACEITQRGEISVWRSEVVSIQQIAQLIMVDPYGPYCKCQCWLLEMLSF
jgi:hypothetical protein